MPFNKFYPKASESVQTKKSNSSTTQEHTAMNTKIIHTKANERRVQLIKELIARIHRIKAKKPSKVKPETEKQSLLSRASGLISKSIWSVSMIFSSNFCFAASAGADKYQFTGALFNIMTELEGAPIIIITAIGIMAAGFFWVFKGHDVGMKQVVSALIGGGLVLAAPNLVMMVPGMTGAVI